MTPASELWETCLLCGRGFCGCMGRQGQFSSGYRRGRPIFIAGVPPDYFSATGQRWGNPIYDWDYLKKKNHYQFWLDRIGYSSKLFDMIRIDHFRALIPSGKFRQPVPSH